MKHFFYESKGFSVCARHKQDAFKLKPNFKSYCSKKIDVTTSKYCFSTYKKLAVKLQDMPLAYSSIYMRSVHSPSVVSFKCESL
jgi:hypothetical protein